MRGSGDRPPQLVEPRPGDTVVMVGFLVIMFVLSSRAAVNQRGERVGTEVTLLRAGQDTEIRRLIVTRSDWRYVERTC